MELCKSVDVTGYLACRIAGRGILDENILGEALSRVEGLYKGIPHYLPIKKYMSSTCTYIVICILSLVEARVKFLKIRLRLNSAHNPYIKYIRRCRPFSWSECFLVTKSMSDGQAGSPNLRLGNSSHFPEPKIT
jgi:hypothetical protein